MNNATSEELDYLADDEELKRFCVVFGVMQSNMMFRILSRKDKAGMFEQLKEEVETGIVKSARGGQKCGEGQVFDEARGICV